MGGQIPLSEKIFRVALKDELGDNYDRCLAIFLRYQDEFSRRIAEIFCKTQKLGSLPQVLVAFERCKSRAEVLQIILLYERSISIRESQPRNIGPFGVIKLN